MNQPSPLEHSSEVESFLETLYESREGYVYCPTKNPESGYWQPYFFQWPQQKEAVVTHILDQTRSKDCYVSPSLFKAPSAQKQSWKGSQFAWVEFDGNAPARPPAGVPEPSLRLQSSTPKHEHWYWRLENFETDSSTLENLCKRLTYTLDADKSGWDSNQVLRPPGTIHQDSKRRVTLLASNSRAHKFSDFKGLIDAPVAAVVDSKFDNLPDVQEVISKYVWSDEAYDLFKKAKQPTGSRSSAMTRLGFHCIEMGMSNEECYVILLNADDRWGKFKHRTPESRAKRLLGIISHCRGKKTVEAELQLSDFEKFVSVGDFLKTELKVKWFYEDFLTDQGLGIISALPGIGKTTLSIRLGMNVCLNKDFLVWKCGFKDQKRVGFVSLEMASLECKKFISDMWPSFTPEEQERIEKNFFLMPLGYSLPMADKKQQQALLDLIDAQKIDFLIIDSLKAATGLDEKKLDLFFDWINKYVRNDRGVTVWIIHHNRKPPNESGGSKKPRGLEDLYGDTFIGAHPTAVIAIWRRGKNDLEVIPLKVRLAEETDPFRIHRTEHLNFEIVEKVSKVVESEPENAGGETASDETTKSKF